MRRLARIEQDMRSFMYVRVAGEPPIAAADSLFRPLLKTARPQDLDYLPHWFVLSQKFDYSTLVVSKDKAWSGARLTGLCPKS